MMPDEVSAMLRDVPFLRVAIPVLSIVAPAVLVYLGVKGILDRRTEVVGGRVAPSNVGPGRVHGLPAVVLGGFYLLAAIVLAAFLGPLAWALVVGP